MTKKFLNEENTKKCAEKRNNITLIYLIHFSHHSCTNTFILIPAVKHLYTADGRINYCDQKIKKLLKTWRLFLRNFESWIKKQVPFEKNNCIYLIITIHNLLNTNTSAQYIYFLCISLHSLSLKNCRYGLIWLDMA